MYVYRHICIIIKKIEDTPKEFHVGGGPKIFRPKAENILGVTHGEGRWVPRKLGTEMVNKIK